MTWEMHGEIVDAAGDIGVRPRELLAPDLLDMGGGLETRARAVELEVGKIVEPPGDGQFDDAEVPAEDIWRIGRGPVTGPHVVWRVIVSIRLES